jgi:hypothetical protein
MKVKTAYRPQKSEAEIPAVAVGQPEGSAAAVSVEHHHEPEPEPVAEIKREESELLSEHAKEVSKADEAAAALKGQIEALRQSEELNRQAAAQAAYSPQRPMTRDEKLAAWKAQGMAQTEYNFLVANPELVDAPNLTAYAANEAAQQGHTRGSEEFLQATKEIFDHYQAPLQAQAQQQTEPAMQETPRFFQPPPPRPPRAQGPIVSAPVSREILTGNPRPEWEENPSRVHLSVDERSIAKACNMTDLEYAKNKILLQRRKASGEIV